jgi:hypothetical protein
MPIRTPDTGSEGPAHTTARLGPARDGESPVAPEVPSFASLRDPRRRTAVDLLVPDVLPAATPPRGPAPRPPDYADLVRLGVHVARAVAAVPVRVARWSVREPVRFARRLLGG